MEVTKLITERKKSYGKAWLTTGEIVAYLEVRGLFSALAVSNLVLSWILILNKLVRALKSPGTLDHWRDIAGYATLVIEELESKRTE